MTDYQKYINALRKCANEHEFDWTPTGHIIVSDLCIDTANLLEQLEQEDILAKIRAEIAELDIKVCQQFLIEDVDKEVHRAYRECLGIINKYKAESEDKE